MFVFDSLPKMSNYPSGRSSKQLSANNSLLGFNTSMNAASTPASSISDPNDEIWLEFLSSLQDPVPSNKSTSHDTSDISAGLNITFTENSNGCATNSMRPGANDAAISGSSSHSYFTKKKSLRHNFNMSHLVDNDDDNDPDFTILDNYELDENYDYMDDWFQVPSKQIRVDLNQDFCFFLWNYPVLNRDSFFLMRETILFLA